MGSRALNKQERLPEKENPYPIKIKVLKLLRKSWIPLASVKSREKADHAPPALAGAAGAAPAPSALRPRRAASRRCFCECQRPEAPKATTPGSAACDYASNSSRGSRTHLQVQGSPARARLAHYRHSLAPASPPQSDAVTVIVKTKSRRHILHFPWK